MVVLNPLVLALLITVSLVAAICPAGSIQGLSPESCYSISKQSLSWTDAEQECVSQGGHLVSVTSDIKNTFIQSTVLYFTSGVFWIGGYKDVVRNKWRWSDGSRWSYTNWAAGQPVSASYCVYYDSSSGQWSATDCGSEQTYLCDLGPIGGVASLQPFPPSLPTVVPPPALCSPGWFALASSDLCYMTVQNYATWPAASAACNQQSGQLVSITNAAVQEELLAQVANLCNGGCWIGLHLSKYSNNFQWSDGSPLAYTNWYPGQPGSTPADSVYMNTQYNGQWMTYDGENQNFDYICERASFVNGR
jgi:hypothetical protein